MPYIIDTSRNKIHDDLLNDERGGLNWTPDNAGQLNFLVSTFADNYLLEQGVNYANVNELIGALECCKLELYRRIAAPYEDIKLEENGEVYAVLEEGI